MGDFVTILTGAYRIFFPFAVLFAGLSVPMWLAFYSGAPAPMEDAYQWHRHEMLWGYLPAAIAGFLFTALPNWTSRPGPGPMMLGAMFAIWLAGRVAMFIMPGAILAQIVASAFLPVVAALALYMLISAGNRRNLVVGAMVTGLWLAQLSFFWLDSERAIEAGFALIFMLMVLIGGRVTPAFTRNWLKARGAARLPGDFGPVDKAALISSALAAISWVILADTIVTGVLAGAAAVALGMRLGRWRGWGVRAEPLLLALHAAYGWLVIAMALLAVASLSDLATLQQVHHALGAGAIGSMTAIIMMRAMLGHSGRPITGNWMDKLAFVALHLGAILRTSADWSPDPMIFYHSGGTFWALGMIVLAVRLFPLALTERPRAFPA